MNKVLGLVAGRHALPVEEYIFDNAIEDVHDYQAMQSVIAGKLSDVRFTQSGGFNKATVYVTGLTPVTVEVVKYCMANFIMLDLMNFDCESGQYVRQSVLRESQFSPMAYDYGMVGL